LGNPQDYGGIHYLYDSLLNDYSFPVKKLHHKTIFHLFSRVADIRGHKDNISAAKKLQIKFGGRCTESVLSCKHSINIKIIKKNHLETQTNAQNNKSQNLSIKTPAVLRIFPHLLNRS
jgi:hypothetical protein